MKLSHWNWLFLGSVIGVTGCAEERATKPQVDERPRKVDVDVGNGKVDVDVRPNPGTNSGGVDVDVKDGKVNVDVK